MKIRRWIIFQVVILLGMLLPGQPAWAVGKKSDGTDYGTAAHSWTIVDRLGDRTLQELRDFHQRELDEDYLGYWQEHGIDWEHGGVMPYRELMKGMPYLPSTII